MKKCYRFRTSRVQGLGFISIGFIQSLSTGNSSIRRIPFCSLMFSEKPHAP